MPERPILILLHEAKEHIAALNATVAACQAIVQGQQSDVEKLSLPDAVRFMDAVRSFKDILQSDVKTPIEGVFDALRFAVIPNAMDTEGITNITVEGVGRCTVTDDVSVTALDKELLMQWMTHNGFEDMITESINAQTLAAFVRRRMKAAEELPTELLKITPVVRASITRS